MRLRQVGVAKIVRGPVVLDYPVVTEAAVFTGQPLTPVVVKLDKQTLKEVWRKRKTASVKGLSGSVLIVWTGKEFQGWDSDDKVLWKRSLPARPYFSGGQLLVLNAGQMQVLDGASGETVDQFPCPDGFPAVLHDDGVLLTMEGDDVVRAVHLVEQRVLWEKNIKDELSAKYGVGPSAFLNVSAGAGPGRFVAALGPQLIGLSLADGECLWDAPVHVPYRRAHVKDGRIYAWTTAPPVDPTIRTTFDVDSKVMVRERPGDLGAENRFLILDEATGTILVDRSLAQYGREFTMRIEPKYGALCKNHIAYSTDVGLLVLFRLSDGELVWSQQHRDEVFSPGFDDGCLYVRSADGTLIAYEAEGGDL